MINNLIVLKLIYNITILHTSYNILHKLDAIFLKYLWDKTHKIKKRIAIARYDNGGLNMIESKYQVLKSSCIPKLLNENSAIANVLNMYLEPIGIDKNLLLKLNF